MLLPLRHQIIPLTRKMGIINLTTGAIHSIELVHAHIDDGIALLTAPSLKTRPSACHDCPYAP